MTEVLRGDYHVGDLVDIQYLSPNWPWAWAFGDDGGPVASCSGGPGWAGDLIVLALDAVQPRQRLEESGRSWIQPRTIYNAVGLLEAEPIGLEDREVVTMEDIRRLVALPMTDTAPPEERGSARGPMSLISAVLTGLLAGILAWRRTRWPSPTTSTHAGFAGRSRW